MDDSRLDRREPCDAHRAEARLPYAAPGIEWEEDLASQIGGCGKLDGAPVEQCAISPKVS